MGIVKNKEIIIDENIIDDNAIFNITDFHERNTTMIECIKYIMRFMKQNPENNNLKCIMNKKLQMYMSDKRLSYKTKKILLKYSKELNYFISRTKSLNDSIMDENETIEDKILLLKYKGQINNVKLSYNNKMKILKYNEEKEIAAIKESYNNEILLLIKYHEDKKRNLLIIIIVVLLLVYYITKK